MQRRENEILVQPLIKKIFLCQLIYNYLIILFLKNLYELLYKKSFKKKLHGL